MCLGLMHSCLLTSLWGNVTSVIFSKIASLLFWVCSHTHTHTQNSHWKRLPNNTRFSFHQYNASKCLCACLFTLHTLWAAVAYSCWCHSSKSQTLNPISLASLLSFAIHFVVVNNFIEPKRTFFIKKKVWENILFGDKTVKTITS